MFRSLRFYNYRVWFLGSLFSNFGVWMQATAQAWVVLTVLTDGDAAAMGVSLALQFLPPVLLIGITGWVADRFDRLRLLVITQFLFVASSALLAVLLLTGTLTLWLMYAVILAGGIVRAFEGPLRQVTVTDIVVVEHASNAVALNSASLNSARLVGPALAGVLLAVVAPGWVFAINTLTFAGMIIAISSLRRDDLVPRARLAGAQGMLEGFRYVRRRPDLWVNFGMAFLIGGIGVNFPLFTSTMTLEFGEGSQEFGLLTAAVAAGALGGALLSASRARASLRMIAFAAGGFGVALVAAAFMPTFWLYAAAIVAMGFCMSIVTAVTNSYTQTTTDAAVRGRVLAVFMGVITGGGPIAALALGWLASGLGPRAANFAGGIAGLVAFAIGATWIVAAIRAHRPFDTELVRSGPEAAEVLPEEFSDPIAEATSPLPLDERDDPVAGTARAR